ncbi:hypothetical protein FBUS_10412 [Fasciolopsis buskii]|uniref:Uncharacterized protein n=1 Tax=Fasciolopsis buskii TaxID=27845 RepID=A0A8E0RMH7_9TREM|nr:hypothetical protein FBUS_10412 [Fasciolopsis buski]
MTVTPLSPKVDDPALQRQAVITSDQWSAPYVDKLRLAVLFPNPPNIRWTTPTVRLKSSTILTTLCAYSAPFNAWKICTARGPTVILADGTEREHPLTCLDGIRLITMMWIIFGHLLLFLLYTSSNSAEKIHP